MQLLRRLDGEGRGEGRLFEKRWGDFWFTPGSLICFSKGKNCYGAAPPAPACTRPASGRAHQRQFYHSFSSFSSSCPSRRAHVGRPSLFLLNLATPLSVFFFSFCSLSLVWHNVVFMPFSSRHPLTCPRCTRRTIDDIYYSERLSISDDDRHGIAVLSLFTSLVLFIAIFLFYKFDFIYTFGLFFVLTFLPLSL